MVRAEPISALYERGLVHHVGRFRVLEDQLCAFTTAGYRGEGSPDHADALVFAIGELLLHDRASILEFYRRKVEDRSDADGKSEPPRNWDLALALPPRAEEGAAAPKVRLQAPNPISSVHGPFGTSYIADGEHCFLVNAADANVLIAHGFVAVAEQSKDSLPIEASEARFIDPTTARSN